MSARRWFQGALVLAALALTAAVRPSHSPQIVARVGGNLAGRVGDTLNVPITVDLTGAPGVRLGGYRMTIRFNPNVLSFQDGSNGTFAQPLVNTDSAGHGMLRMTAIQPSGADGVVTLGVGQFRVRSDTGSSDITVTFEEMSGVAPTFDDLLPLLTVVNGTFCHASGKWGDVDGDGQANSRDALIALSRVVGIALDTVRVDTITVPDSGARYDTLVTLRPGLADVDGDAQVTSRDALIIMSYAVGLPVPGFRIGLAAAGACGGSGLGLSIALAPDTLELQSGQTANAVVSARDASGNPASLNGATWTSSNTAVAGVTSPGFGIVARDPGVAVLTARLGASYRASMVVQVVAHRTRWFVDVAQSRAAIQTGSHAFPFAFIQDAFDAGQDGDTIDVAPGTYEESVHSDISVYLRGDPVHPPVLDPRGSFSYYAIGAGLFAGSRVAPMRIDNLVVLHGRIAVGSHDFAAHNLHIEGIDSVEVGAALFFESATTMAPGAPPAGVRAGADIFPADTGNIVLDSVTIHGYGANGIEIGLADTVIIRHSAVTRDSTFFPACGIEGRGGIYVNQASRTEISNTTVLNAPCVGIGVLQQGGSAWISGNTVDRAGGTGIVTSVPVVAFDHNTVTRIISGNSSAQAAGMLVFDEVIAQSVTSVGDVIRGSGDRGFAVWGARSATIDALTVDTTGLDGTRTSAGVEFWGGHLTLTNSRISNTFGGNGAIAYVPDDTTHSVLESRHNVIWNTGSDGLLSAATIPGGGYAPPVFGAPRVERGAMDYFGNKGPDTLISVGDTILNAGDAGIEADKGVYARIDSAVVDNAASVGVYLYTLGVALVRDSRIRQVAQYSDGIDAGPIDSVTISRSAVVGGFHGIVVGPSVRGSIYGTSVDSATYAVDHEGGQPLVVDSSRLTAAAVGFYSGQASDSLTRSTIAGNDVGILLSYNGGGNSARMTVRYSNIFGNRTGAENQYPGLMLIDADTNYWGDHYGPTCNVEGGVTGCDPLAVLGDTVLTPGITFADWLTSPATDVMAAPRFLRPVARRPSLAAVADRPPRPAHAPRPTAAARPAPRAASAHPASLGAARSQPRPSGPMMSWRRGQPPKPAKVHHPS